MNMTGVFYDSDIAMMEHEVIDRNEIADWRADALQMYIMGVHDMAKKVIATIRKEES